MEPRDFLDLAGTLMKQPRCEAALRTSVSRSYYALHNYLSQFIICEGFDLPETADRHNIVFRDLHNCALTNVGLIAKSLDELRDERNDADYELGLTKFQSENHAVLLFIKAQTAYNDFEKLTGSRKKRRQIAKGIREYRKKVQR